MIYPVVLLLIGILTVDLVTSSSCPEDQGIMLPHLTLPSHMVLCSGGIETSYQS